MSGRLVHIGSAVVDYVYRIDALPAPGTEKTASSFAQVAGGGFNMMVAATRTGMTVVFGGQLGSGPNGDFLRAAFAAEGIETLTPPSPVMDSGNCVAMISSDAERTFVSWPGAESVLSLDMMAPVSVRAWRLGVHLRLYAELSRQPRRAHRLDRGAAGKHSLRLRPDAGHFRHSAPDPVAGACPHDMAELQHDGSRRDRRPGRCRGACGAAACRPLPAGRRRRHPLRRQGLPCQAGRRHGADHRRFQGRRHRHQWRRRHPYRRFRQRAGARRAALRGGALRQCGGGHFGHPPWRLIGADRCRNPDFPEPGLPSTGAPGQTKKAHQTA